MPERGIDPGTSRIGLDDGAVVDPDLRLNGVDGLRGVDVSVLPRVVSGHCQGAVLAIAVKAADLLTGRTPLTAGDPATVQQTPPATADGARPARASTTPAHARVQEEPCPHPRPRPPTPARSGSAAT